VKCRSFAVRHPAMSKTLEPSGGRGGPAPGPGGVLGPAIPVNPIAPGSPPADAAGQALNSVGQSILQAVKQFLAPGQIMLGVGFIVVGLLLATGLMGRVARTGVGVATRGAIR
jgi:hypothetical protein